VALEPSLNKPFELRLSGSLLLASLALDDASTAQPGASDTACGIDVDELMVFDSHPFERGSLFDRCQRCQDLVGL
jgi:hypothetical protein